MRPLAPLIGAALLLTGCAHIPAVDDGLGAVERNSRLAAIADWNLSGQLIVDTGERRDRVRISWEQRGGLDGDSQSAKRKILRADGFNAERLAFRLLCGGDDVLLSSVRRSGPDGDRDLREYTTADVDDVLVPLGGETPIDGEGTVLKDVGALCRPRSV